MVANIVGPPGRATKSVTHFGGFDWSHRSYVDEIIAHAIVSKGNETIVDLFLNTWIALLADCPVDCQPNRQGVHTFITKCINEPLKDTLAFFSGLAHDLMKYPRREAGVILTGDFIPQFCKTPVFRAYNKWYKTGDRVAYRYLVTFLSFGKKLAIEDDTLTASAFRTWLRTEYRLCGLPMPSDTSRVKAIMSTLLTGPPVVPFYGKHGPGSTSSGDRDIFKKLSNIRGHKRLDKYINRSYDRNMHHIGFGYDGMQHSVYNWKKGSTDDTARLIFVPKNIKTARAICMEPIAFQFCQQSYRWELEEMMSEGYSELINLSKQVYNQEAARKGSISGKLDTIDLSAASDSVHIDIVRQCFPKNVLYYLLATRTSKVSYDDHVFKVKKFAPMGSALCFPVQSILFSTIAILAYLYHAYDVDDRIDMEINNPGLLKRLKRRGYSLPIVYGDDIICDAKVTPILIDLLSQFGLIVNEDKSFMGNQAFRESCGEFYLDGTNVTPTLFRVKHHNDIRLSFTTYASLLENINRLGKFKYVHARSFLINTLLWQYVLPGKKWGKRNLVPFSNDENMALSIFTTSMRNDHLAGRGFEKGLPCEGHDIDCKCSSCRQTSQRFQRDEKRCIRGLPSNKKGCPDELFYNFEDYSLQTWHRSHNNSEVKGDLSTVTHVEKIPQDNRLVLRWTPRL